MRIYLVIFSGILAYLLLGSRSCDPDNGEDSISARSKLKQTKDSIRNGFESAELSPETLKAFEMSACRKLTDLADYIRIYSDKSVDKSFKNQARQMIIDMFADSAIVINRKITEAGKPGNVSLSEFLDQQIAEKGFTGETVFDSISVTNHLTRTSESIYSGSLSFVRNIEVRTPSGKVLKNSAGMNAGFYAIKKSKLFGNDTLTIWSVFLGEIK